MKTRITLGTFAILLALFFTSYSDVIANSGGSQGGFSSSGGDNGNSCGQGGCHGGGHTLQAGIITTNIPMSGYTPGTTYRINVAGTSGTGTKFGFELAAENASNATAGTLTPASTGAREKIRSNGHATHTSVGNIGTMGAFGWQLDWVAPASGTGVVKFSTAVLVANNNGGTAGDATIRFNTTTNEASANSITEITSDNTKLYPNPIENHLNIFSDNTAVNYLSVMNVEGKIVFETSISSVDRVDLSQLKKGIYFATIKSNKANFTQRVIKL